MDKLFIVFEYDDTYSGVGDSIVTDANGSYVFVSELIDFWRMHGKPWNDNKNVPAPVSQKVYGYLNES